MLKIPKSKFEIFDFFKGLRRNVCPTHRLMPEYLLYLSFIKNKNGIEIGGPSPIFKTMIPIYQTANRIDGVNFADNTIWEGQIKEGETYGYIKGKKGRQYIAEATDLSKIPTESYDFLVSSNCLEHVADTLKALKEWNRVIKKGGAFILALPNPAECFDRNRPVTSFEHFLMDSKNEVGEDDLTHLDEILELHDLSLDPPAGSFEEFKLRSLDNFRNRALHHHVFDVPLIKKMLEYSNFKVLNICETKPGPFSLAIKL